MHTLTPTASKLGQPEPFGVAHLRLMKEDNTIIRDNKYKLFVYKVRDGE